MNNSQKKQILFSFTNPFPVWSLITTPIIISGLYSIIHYLSSQSITNKTHDQFMFFLGIFLIKSILWIFIAIPIIGIINAYWLGRYKGPIVILNETGVWVRNYNHIPWGNIKEVSLQNFSIGSNKVGPEVIGILAKSFKELFKNSTLNGKLGLIWIKLFSYRYHITLPPFNLKQNKSIENQKILNFAKQYIKNS